MDSGAGGTAVGDWGEPGPPPRFDAEPRRLLLSPVRACCSSSSSPSSSLGGAGCPPMDKPPGMLFAGAPGILIGPEERPKGAPTGIDEGSEP